jgi:crossover junction endodeoxyribonuclease RusA
VIAFTVRGKPEPGGSKKGFVIKGHVVIADANAKVKPWRKKVAAVAREKMAGQALMEGPLEATFHFAMPRPKTVKRRDHTVRPDTTKLVRAVEDALTGVVYADDAQIVKQHASKFYALDEPQVTVVIKHV